MTCIWESFLVLRCPRFSKNNYLKHGVKILKQSGIEVIESGSQARLTDGQVVDFELLYLETSDLNVYAAGDVANYPDLLFCSKRRRVEHWDNAVSQGQHLSNALLGNREPFVHVPYFFSDVFDLSYKFWGNVSQANRIVHRSDLRTNSFSVWWLSQNRLIAAFTMNRPDNEREFIPELIRSKHPLSSEALARRKLPYDALA